MNSPREIPANRRLSIMLNTKTEEIKMDLQQDPGQFGKYSVGVDDDDRNRIIT